MPYTCYRCHGLTVRDRFEDLREGSRPLEGYKCVNCGACGDLPTAQWRRDGVISPFYLQRVGGACNENGKALN